jgi:hypothetical protein
MSEREISCQISKERKASATPTAPSGAESCQSELTVFHRSASEIVQPDGRGRVGTIRILVENADRRGRSSASLPDGTILVGSSRQPFLDAARVLVASGYDPDSWLESWRPGASAYALRGRLGIAAGLTVDETKTAFSKWKAFSSSAVPSCIGYSEAPASNVAPGPSGLVQPPPSDEELESISSAPPR